MSCKCDECPVRQQCQESDQEMTCKDCIYELISIGSLRNLKKLEKGKKKIMEDIKEYNLNTEENFKENWCLKCKIKNKCNLVPTTKETIEGKSPTKNTTYCLRYRPYKDVVTKRYAEVLFYSDGDIRLSGTNSKCFYYRGQYPNIMSIDYVKYWVSMYGKNIDCKRTSTGGFIKRIELWDNNKDNQKLYDEMVNTIYKKLNKQI